MPSNGIRGHFKIFPALLTKLEETEVQVFLGSVGSSLEAGDMGSKAEVAVHLTMVQKWGTSKTPLSPEPNPYIHEVSRIALAVAPLFDVRPFGISVLSILGIWGGDVCAKFLTFVSLAVPEPPSQFFIFSLYYS